MQDIANMENKKMKEILPGIDSRIRINGRCRVMNPLPLFWTSSGIEMVTDSTELYIDIETDYDVYEEWIRIEVDGFQMIRMALPRGKSTVTVFRGMVPGGKRHIKLFKEVQPMFDDESAMLLISAVHGDGEFYEVPDRKYKIEFIGDSLTSGEGLAGSRRFHEWNGISFSTIGSYTELTADMLDADYRIISQSGWGVYCSWDNVPYNTMPRVYDDYCSVIKGRISERFKTDEEYDFASWQPDAVVVNLGTNDEGAFTNPAWTDPKTGIRYKQDINDGGISTGRFEDAVISFLRDIRLHNPKAHIVWAYGMVTDKLEPYISEAINRYKDDDRDELVSLVMLPGLRPEWIGANEHPGVLSHRAAADVLAEKLRSVL